jgi:YggT family protein
MSLIGGLVDSIINALIIMFFARALISWLFVLNIRNQLINQVNSVLALFTEPIVAPIRRVIPPMGSIDISFMVAIFLLIFVQRMVSKAL